MLLILPTDFASDTLLSLNGNLHRVSSDLMSAKIQRESFLKAQSDKLSSEQALSLALRATSCL